MDSSIHDDVYECAFFPEAWSDILARLAGIAGARSGFMMISQQDKHQFVGSNPIVRAAVGPLAVNGVIARTDRFRRLCRAERPGFLREADVYTEDELQADPFYAQVICPQGLGHAAGTTFVLPTGERVLVSLEREWARGPVEAGAIDQLDELRPHIARAAVIAARLQLQSAISATTTLAAVGLPAAAFDEQGRTLVANGLMEEMSEIAIWAPSTDWRSPTRRQIGSCAKGSQSLIAPKATPFSRFRCGMETDARSRSRISFRFAARRETYFLAASRSWRFGRSRRRTPRPSKWCARCSI